MCLCMLIQFHIRLRQYVCLNTTQGVQCRVALVVHFFVFLQLFLFCFVAAIFDLVHAVDAIHGLC